MRFGIWSLILVQTGLILGCGGPAKGKKTTIDLKDVPPNIMKIAKDNLPGVEFDTAWKKESGVFEVQGKAKNGKVREIDIRPDGSIEEIE
jgi:hypothetical protein